MSDNKDPENLGSLILTAVAGLPVALSKSAVGALNRLVAGVADIPAAYLTGWKERVEDTNYERRQFRRSLVNSAISEVSVDKHLINRTIDRLLEDQTRKQLNREAVARETMVILEAANETAQPDQPEIIDQDWLNSFEKFVEDASSERMRNLWGQVLAGEIVRPGSFGRHTLRFLHELDQRTAKAFEEVANYVLGDQVFLSEKGADRVFGEMLHLGSVGALSGVGGLVHSQRSTDSKGRFFIKGKNFCFVGLDEPNTEVSLDATPLTAVGIEILQIVPNPDESHTIRELAESLKKPTGFSGKAIKGAALGINNGDKIKLVEHLWGESPFGIA